MSSLSWLLPVLSCPVCGGSLAFDADGPDDDGVLHHDSGACHENYPVIGGIPRLLDAINRKDVATRHQAWFQRSELRRRIWEEWRPADARDETVIAFDDEWTRFRTVTSEHEAIFDLYFDIVPRSAFDPSSVVLDAGCGAGRWASETAARGPRVVAMDLGASVELARANTDPNRVGCVQADVRVVPFQEGAFSWAYSLGVLHHTDDPEHSLSRIVRAIRPGGLALIYFYYALDNRGLPYHMLFLPVTLIRSVVSRLPRPAARTISDLAAVTLYWPLARLASLVDSMGFGHAAAKLPLAAYRNRSFQLMRNDSLDRFGTRVERRYSRIQLVRLMEGVGLEQIEVSTASPFWHAIGFRAFKS